VATIKVETARRLRGMKKASAKKASTVVNPCRKAANNKRRDKGLFWCARTGRCFFGHNLSLVPFRKEPTEQASATNKQLAFCKRVFPPGTMSFTVPNDDTTPGPSDPNCAARRESPCHAMGFESPRPFPTLLLLRTWRAGPRALGLHQK
jgi:hypothetical protein